MPDTPRLKPSDLAAAVAIAGVVSGVPSTLDAWWRDRSVLDATRAAGTLLGRPSTARGLVAHVGLSIGWGTVLGRVLPRNHRVVVGALAGAGIAALDLGVIARRYPAIRALPQPAQWADHVVFGAVVGAVLSARERAVALVDSVVDGEIIGLTRVK